MIEKIPFGRTGHSSTRVIFGAAALAAMQQDRADAVLETLLEFGVNHIDTAAAYGASELRIAPWLQRHRDDFFLATKTRERGGPEARAGLEQSLTRLGVDCVDLIQLHNLVDEVGWQQAFAPGGAVEALAAAREAGLVRFIGVTGHGTQVASMHLRSLERFAFDSVLIPCNHTQLAQPDYARDFDTLLATCHERGIAVQTIKAAARRRWQGDEARRFSWYEPLLDPDALRRAVHYVLSRPGVFLNTSSDARLLRPILEAAAEPTHVMPGANELAEDAERFGMEPLFVPGMDTI